VCLALTWDHEQLEVVVFPPDVLVLALCVAGLWLARGPRPLDEHADVECVVVVLEIQLGGQVVLHTSALIYEGSMDGGICPFLVPYFPVDHWRFGRRGNRDDRLP